nr:integrase, catalytic region, zinc finger, CCHC-type, peptidase aspartic, catalytic [Tanacetum cinerariifolium]
MASSADKAILLGADNRPPMLEKDMYDSWKSRMELYMLNRPHGIMILESVEQGPLIWPSAEAIQADCDVKATNIILQGLPQENYVSAGSLRPFTSGQRGAQGKQWVITCYNYKGEGQFCDSDLEVAFRQHTCFIRNLEGVDLVTSSRGNNLYTLSLQNMMASSPICLLSKASKTKSWLWHRRLSHLNFGAINHLARQGLVRDNGTEFVNQTLRDYYEEVGISHETSVARSPQQNGVVKRRNRTLIKAARTMLIYAQA